MLCDKAFNVAKNPLELLQWFTKFWIKRLWSPSIIGTGVVSKAVLKNQELTKESQKLVIRKFKDCKVHFSYKDNIRNADLAIM